MIERTDLPRPVIQQDDVWIPLADGLRLAARLWRPADAEENPVPAILELLPYRRNDGTAVRDSTMHPYLAAHGYACLRVDMRGSGDSDGVLLDEYLPTEQDDAVGVIAWMAHQPWCNGAVGMWGISWGGFNSLQVAARRPPELRAVMSLCSTDDRYADDVHYRGGCLLAADALPWASVMLAANAEPPDPRFVGETWRELWRERLDGSPPFIEAWLSHPTRDDYWKHGSVCEDFSRIQVPVYAIGGWEDGYTNAVPRLLAGLAGPRKGLIGPWAHAYPHFATPGPQIGFLQEALRFWDRWLLERETGVMDEPMLRAWMQEPGPLDPQRLEVPGRWIAEPAWPPEEACEPEDLLLTAGGELAPATGSGSGNPMERAIEIATVLHHGADAGAWCSYGAPGEAPGDQHGDDARSCCFEGEPVRERTEILGFPELRLRVAADRPVAQVAVRLCDVAPDGTSRLVSRGVSNLTHRDSHEQPRPLEPGRPVDVALRLDAIAWSMPAGHRWRLALAPSYWPIVWPAPELVTLTVLAGPGCRLRLPRRAPRREDDELAPFGPAEGAPRIARVLLRPGSRDRRLVLDDATRRQTLETGSDSGHVRWLSLELETERVGHDIHSIVEGDPLSARVTCSRRFELRRGDWRVRGETESDMTCDAERFHVTNVVRAWEGERQVHERERRFDVDRLLV
ncbi:MAG TPA: CocE/NonD family hydrolase [Thermoanaerobaculia bacterium]|nr:CocE/NonD family hydrolase [Thermoanaerobaculia bacterium]